MGPRAVVAKQGEYGAALFTGGGFFALPAFPLETVVDPGRRRLVRGRPSVTSPHRTPSWTTTRCAAR